MQEPGLYSKVVVALRYGYDVDDDRTSCCGMLVQSILTLSQMLSLQLCRPLVAVEPDAALESGRHPAMAS